MGFGVYTAVNIYTVVLCVEHLHLQGTGDFYHKYEGISFLQQVGKHLQVYTVKQKR
jgi:hypothetical protein